MKKYLSETIQEHKVTFDAESIRDFIDLYIKATEDKSAPEIFTGKNLCHTVGKRITRGSRYRIILFYDAIQLGEHHKSYQSVYVQADVGLHCVHDIASDRALF